MKGVVEPRAASPSAGSSSAMTVGSKPAQTEEYYDWKVGVDLSGELFEASSWTTAPPAASSSTTFSPRSTPQASPGERSLHWQE